MNHREVRGSLYVLVPGVDGSAVYDPGRGTLRRRPSCKRDQRMLFRLGLIFLVFSMSIHVDLPLLGAHSINSQHPQAAPQDLAPASTEASAAETCMSAAEMVETSVRARMEQLMREILEELSIHLVEGGRWRVGF